MKLSFAVKSVQEILTIKRRWPFKRVQKNSTMETMGMWPGCSGLRSEVSPMRVTTKERLSCGTFAMLPALDPGLEEKMRNDGKPVA